MKREWTYSSVGQSTRLITGVSQVRVLVGPPPNWDVVQLAVRQTVNLKVVGSSPAVPVFVPIVKWISQWTSNPPFQVRVLVGAPFNHLIQGETN